MRCYLPLLALTACIDLPQPPSPEPQPAGVSTSTVVEPEVFWEDPEDAGLPSDEGGFLVRLPKDPYVD